MRSLGVGSQKMLQISLFLTSSRRCFANRARNGKSVPFDGDCEPLILPWAILHMRRGPWGRRVLSLDATGVRECNQSINLQASWFCHFFPQNGKSVQFDGDWESLMLMLAILHMQESWGQGVLSLDTIGARESNLVNCWSTFLSILPLLIWHADSHTQRRLNGRWGYLIAVSIKKMQPNSVTIRPLL
jgi:hypothetical protein